MAAFIFLIEPVLIMHLPFPPSSTQTLSFLVPFIPPNQQLRIEIWVNSNILSSSHNSDYHRIIKITPPIPEAQFTPPLSIHQL